MQRQLLERQAEVEAAAAEAARLGGERAALERQQARLAQEAAAADRQLLERLGEQTFAEKGAAATLREIEAVRAGIAEREAAAERQRAALEKLGSDAEACQAGNAALAATLAGLERGLADKAAGVASLEAAVRVGHAEVEARTRQLELLNKRYRRLVESQTNVETGGWPGGMYGVGAACVGRAPGVPARADRGAAARVAAGPTRLGMLRVMRLCLVRRPHC